MPAAEFIGLAFYFFQQLGMALGIGAETVSLATHRDAVAKMPTAWVMRAALTLIVVSGIVITGAHLAAGEAGVLLQPSYLFKWLLIAALIALGAKASWGGKFRAALSGGTWYALFALHTLAPEASWPLLLAAYGAWMLLFVAAYELFVRDRIATVGAAPPRAAYREPELFKAPAPAEVPKPAASLAIHPIPPAAPPRLSAVMFAAVRKPVAPAPAPQKPPLPAPPAAMPPRSTSAAPAFAPPPANLPTAAPYRTMPMPPSPPKPAASLLATPASFASSAAPAPPQQNPPASGPFKYEGLPNIQVMPKIKTQGKNQE